MTGMTCANCAMNIERTLNRKIPGVLNGSVNFASERASVEYVPGLTDIDEIIAAIEKAGFGAIRPDDSEGAEDAEMAVRTGRDSESDKKIYNRCDLCGPSIFYKYEQGLRPDRTMEPTQHGSTGFSLPWQRLSSSIPAGITTLGGGRVSGIRAPTWTVLVAMGSSVAYFYSLALLLYSPLGEHVYFETSAVIITLIKLGKMLEARTKGRTGGAIRKLMDLRPRPPLY